MDVIPAQIYHYDNSERKSFWKGDLFFQREPGEDGRITLSKELHEMIASRKETVLVDISMSHGKKEIVYKKLDLTDGLLGVIIIKEEGSETVKRFIDILTKIVKANFNDLE